MAGVARNTINSIERGYVTPIAKLTLILCITFEVKFEDLFYEQNEQTLYKNNLTLYKCSVRLFLYVRLCFNVIV